MTYKRVVEKGGKKYNYYYQSYREGDKVKKIYIGNEEDYKKWLAKKEGKERRTTSIKTLGEFDKKWLIIPAILLIVFAGIFIYNLNVTGRAGLNIENSYIYGENITGSLRLNLKQGELLPMNSKIIIEQQGDVKEIVLSQILSSNANGSFYAEGYEISGQGEGYGFSGKKIVYPEINFVFKIVKSEKDNESETGGGGNEGVTGNETITVQPVEEPVENQTELPEEIPTGNETQPVEEQPAVETPEETPTEEIPAEEPIQIEQPEETPIEEIPAETETTPTQENPSQDKKEEKTEQKAEKQESKAEEKAETPAPSESAPAESAPVPAPESSPITGAAVKEDEFEGKVSKNKSFSYNINKNKDIEIVSVDKGGIGDLKKERKDDLIEVTTEYSEEIEGFGQDYLGELKKVEIDLTSLGILAREGTLKISLVYGDSILASVSKDISVLNETIPILNETIMNETIMNETIMNETIIILNKTAGNITLKQYKAVINQPVKWHKRISGNGTGMSVELPREAVNISVKTGSAILEAEKEAEQQDKLVESNKTALITGNVIGKVSLELETKKPGIFTRFWNWMTGSRITGNVILGNDSLGTAVPNSSKTEGFRDVIDTGSSKILSVNENASEMLVEYYTTAPSSNESETGNGKNVVISADDKLNYTDILAYTQLNNVAPVNSSIIKLYWHASYEDAVRHGYVVVNQTTEIINQNNSNNGSSVITNSTEIVTNGTIVEIINQTLNNSSSIINQSETIVNEVVNNTASDGGQNISGVSGITGNVVLEENSLINNNSEMQGSANLSNVISNNSSGADRAYVVSIPFSEYDLDGDGNVDYIEWNVPHLSNQFYEIIYITKAEHLDENYTFVEDVYEQVRAQDGSWATINDSHYLRVTFEQNLTNKKDITIYARDARISNNSILINNNSIPLDVYEKKKRIDEIRRLLEND